MIYKQFKDKQLSALGFGTMRLPLLPGGGPGDIDQDAVNRMVDYAIAHGVNYFDTAKPYHAGKSELSIGKALARHPRESWYLADKFPGHQVVKGIDIPLAETFEEELKACGVDYFDFYLLHNVNEHSAKYYMDRSKGCVDYFVQQRELGRIHHLGFSCHSDAAGLEAFLDMYGEYMEFCQIQLNYLDWTLQGAKEKCALLAERGIPVWVMEPVRGGQLAKLDAESEAKMRALRPEESIAAWAFRWLETVPQPTMVLSGMSDLSQMVDNIRTFEEPKPLNEEELQVVYTAADRLSALIPCTGCRYCCAGCPKQLNIPLLISLCNDMRIDAPMNAIARYDALDDKRASACIGCGKCRIACPQNIDVPAAMKELVALREGKKSWVDICIERDQAAKALRAEQAGMK